MAKSNLPPIEEVRLLPTDFERFRPEIQRNPEFNAYRLEIRRKLDAIGKHLAAALAKEGMALTSRASLHHPYRFNSFKVESQWVYLSRADKERRDLKRILGVELGEDLDQSYTHTLLVLEIHQHGIEIALRIHKDAWWDGENFKRKVLNAAEREKLAALLRPLAGYGLSIHDFRNVHDCARITAEELLATIQYYKPGEHWLHIASEIRRDDARVLSAEFVTHLQKEFTALLPLYRFAAWTKENNFLFTGG